MRTALPLLFTVLLTPFASSQNIPLDNFRDSIKHWRDQNDNAYRRYTPDQSKEIAENILLHQRDNGGWKQNTDPLRILSEAETLDLLDQKPQLDTSLDNRNTYPQIEYLAHAFLIHGDERYQRACLAGLDFLLGSQLENGGFTHSPPNTENYRGYITFMDEVMTGSLTTLNKAAQRRPPFQWLPDPYVEAATDAVASGNALILQLQIKQGETLTAWAGQYHPTSLEPMQARSFELPSLVSQESAAVVSYLMTIDNPKPEIVTSIEAAVHWLEAVKIEGLRVRYDPIEPIRYRYHTANYDPIAELDPTAPAIWARFYALDDSSPLFANRESERVPRFADIPHERRTGYAWYGYWPKNLLENEYPAWLARLSN